MPVFALSQDYQRSLLKGQDFVVDGEDLVLVNEVTLVQATGAPVLLRFEPGLRLVPDKDDLGRKRYILKGTVTKPVGAPVQEPALNARLGFFFSKPGTAVASLSTFFWTIDQSGDVEVVDSWFSVADPAVFAEACFFTAWCGS